VLDGDPAPHNSPSPLSAHAYCGQTVDHLSNCWPLVHVQAGSLPVNQPTGNSKHCL